MWGGGGGGGGEMYIYLVICKEGIIITKFLPDKMLACVLTLDLIRRNHNIHQFFTRQDESISAKQECQDPKQTVENDQTTLRVKTQ